MPRTELDKKMSTPAKQVANSPSNQEERGGPVNRCSHSEALFTFSQKKIFTVPSNLNLLIYVWILNIDKKIIVQFSYKS